MRAVQDETRRSDDAVATFFLDAGQAGQKFVGDIFAQAFFAERAAGNDEYFRRAVRCLAILLEAADAEAGRGGIVNLAEIVVQPLHIHP